MPLGETDKCTFALTGERYAPHSQWFNCFTCGLVGAEGCCLACAGECHRGHALLPRGPTLAFFCDCGAGAKGLQCRAKAAKEEREKGKEKEKEQEKEAEGLPTSEEDLMKLKVGELKAALDARGVSYADCVDKYHLVEKIRSTNTSPAPSAPASPIVPPASPAEEEVKNEEKNAEAEVEAEVEETPEEEWEEDWEEEKEKEAEEQPKPEEATPEEPKQEPTAFVQKLQFLESMGFNDRTRNIEVLIRHVGNLNGAVAELVNSDSAWA